MAMHMAHPPNVHCSGGAGGGGIGSRVIRIRLQVGQTPFLSSWYLWHANDTRRLWDIRVMTSPGDRRVVDHGTRHVEAIDVILY
jgi:hypothetical protein